MEEVRADPYEWSQTLRDVTLSIALPAGVSNKRQITVVFKPDRLRVQFKGHESAAIDGELDKRIKVEDSTWYMEEGKLKVELVKVKSDEWWKCVIRGHKEIDTTKLVPEDSKLSDLDGETRAVVEKMMLDQRRKQAGLPSLEEEKQMEMIKKLQEANPNMDFSNVKIGGQGAGGMFGN